MLLSGCSHRVLLIRQLICSTNAFILSVLFSDLFYQVVLFDEQFSSMSTFINSFRQVGILVFGRSQDKNNTQQSYILNGNLLLQLFKQVTPKH
jgi:hypothetical protein